MGDILLITGGSRSGKSSYALRLAEDRLGPRGYVATCPPVDEEMQERIRRHQATRRQQGWETIEETINLADALADADRFNVLVVDCLTLWVNNLMQGAREKGRNLTEEEVEERSRGLISVCEDLDATTIFVTNEVGMGIVPANAEARRFRDLAGRCNQTIAQAAREVTLMVCGHPVSVKEK